MNDQQFPNIPLGGTVPEPYLRDLEFVDGYVHKDFAKWFKNFDGINAHRFFEDFDYWVTGDWTETHTGTGSLAAQDTVNGVLLITTAAGATDNELISLVKKTFNLNAGYPLYLEARIKVGDVSKQGFVFGLADAVTHYTSAIANNGALLRFASGELDGVSMDSTVDTTGAVLDALAADITLVAATWYRLGIHWDGVNALRFFVFKDEDEPQTLIGYVKVAHTAASTVLNLILGTKNAETAAKTLYVDYIKVAQKRAL